MAQLDVRALRYFVAAAEELHFTRAAARLFVAQQALSRAIAQLERELGVELFVRTTRHVALTPAGERLLGRARELLALHDRTITEVVGESRPVVVDLLSAGRRTGRRVLDIARHNRPDLEFRGRHSSGFGATLADVLAGDVDVAFGRASWLGGTLPAGLQQQLVRFEPLGLLLPEGHALLDTASVTLAALNGVELDAGVGNPKAPEWQDLAGQLLAFGQARPTPPHLPAEGAEEQAHHLAKQGLPILTGMDHVPVPGGQLRAIVEPIPLYPWSLVYRTDGNPVATRVLLEAAAHLAHQEGWLERPAGAWLPEPERMLFSP